MPDIGDKVGIEFGIKSMTNQAHATLRAHEAMYRPDPAFCDALLASTQQTLENLNDQLQ